MSQMQVKVLYVGTPVANTTTSGTFYNQDVLVSELTANNTYAMRVTSGPQRKDISTFALKKDEEVEVTFFARAQLSKQNQLFNQLNITHVERDRSKWGQAHATNDASDIVSRLEAGTSPAPTPAAAPTVAAPAAAPTPAALAPTDDLPF